MLPEWEAGGQVGEIGGSIVPMTENPAYPDMYPDSSPNQRYPGGQIRLDRETTAVVPDTAGPALRGRTPEDLRVVAVTVAAEAAAHVESARAGAEDPRGRVSVQETKSSAVDPVTAIDRSSEDLIRRRLRELTSDEHVPGTGSDAVLGEEDGGALATDRVTWVVDPVDGTVNLVYGIPAFAVSIAACVDGVPVAGAVADVARGEVYSAAVGGEALLTGVQGSAVMTEDALPGCDDRMSDLSRALVGTGFSYDSERRGAQAELLTEILPAVRDIRRVGSAALDLCAVAAGRLDAYYEHGLGPWDHAAGCLIAARAGAVVHMPPLDAGSVEGVGILVASPGIAEELAGRVVRVTFPAPS